MWDGKSPRGRKSAMLRTCSTPLAAAHDGPGLGASAPGPRTREPAPAASTRRPHPTYSRSTTPSAAPLGQVAVGPGSSIVSWLARAPEDRHARHGGALAPSGLAPMLALEISLPRRSSASQSRGARPHRHHFARESAVGHRTDQRRIAQTEHRGQQSLDPALSLAWTIVLAAPDLAHVPAQPCSSPLGC